MACAASWRLWECPSHLFQSRGRGAQVSLDCGHIILLLASFFTPALPLCFFFVCGHKSYWARIHPNSLASTCLPLQRPCFQTRPAPSDGGQDFSTSFWGWGWGWGGEGRIQPRTGRLVGGRGGGATPRPFSSKIRPLTPAAPLPEHALLSPPASHPCSRSLWRFSDCSFLCEGIL